MVMVSTRGKDSKNLSEAILNGLASDGGLFIPPSFKKIDFEPYIEIADKDNAYGIIAKAVLSSFFEGDEIQDKLESIINKAFDFPCPLKLMNDNKGAYLELFCGPTAAFKDFGARFLACSMEAILQKRGGNLTVLVATSGDTGSAVAGAFYKKEGIKVKILFPKGGISPRQKKLLTVWGENIESYEVDGTFDDCQRMVKEAFGDSEYRKKYNLTSANSINIARLLPQMTYYVYSSCLYKKLTGKDPIFIIPSGNVGNATSAYYAKTIGATIKQIVLAQNANRPVVDYLESGIYTPRTSVKTLANAMDVGAPSNAERMFKLYPSYEEFKNNVSAYSISDEEIIKTIKSTYNTQNNIICPHTACAKKVYDDYFNGENAIVVCTAHPAKFEKIIYDALGVEVDLPPFLTKLLAQKEIYKNIGNNYREIFDE